MEPELLEHILSVMRRLAETQTLAPLLTYVMDEAIQLVGAERGYVVLVGPGGALDFRVKRGRGGVDLKDAEEQISRSVLYQAVGSGQPLLLNDALNDSRFRKAESVVALGLRSIMCVPLISRGETIGAIYVENRSLRNCFGQDDLPPLILFANQAAVEIENTRLFEELQAAHHELEVRVQQRTAELAQAKTALEAANAQLQARNAELEVALGTIKTLSGFVPLCAWCHNKIRDEAGAWVKLEVYIEERSEAKITHSICPECARRAGVPNSAPGTGGC